MTFRISAVAVWRSSASLVSLNSRAFSMATTAWSAKVCSSAISLSLKPSSRRRETPIMPRPRPSLINGIAIRP
jgi:hypothetical protein